MTADCRDHKDVEKTIQEVKYSWQYAGNTFSSEPRRQKSNCLRHIVTQFMDVLFGVIHTVSENLLSAIVTHSNDLLT